MADGHSHEIGHQQELTKLKEKLGGSQQGEISHRL